MVHEILGALLVLNGVTFVPRRAMDVKSQIVNFYKFSWYKVFGPRILILYTSKGAQQHMRIIGHQCKADDSLKNLLGLAGANHELAAAIPGAGRYLAGQSPDEIAAYDERLQKIPIDYLLSKGDTIQIWGEPVADKTKRVPVISFTVKNRSSKDIVDQSGQE